MPTIKTSKKLKGIPLTISDTPTSFTDNIIIGKASDGSILMRFISDIPDLKIENHRTVIREGLAKKLIDILCNQTEYYPQKPKKKTAKPKAKPKAKAKAKK